MSAFDDMVSQLVVVGFSRETAEDQVRRQRPELAPAPAVVAKNAGIREKQEQAAIIKLFREHGFTVRSTSQARPSKIAIGFPDLFCTHKTLPLAFFWESKRQVGGVVSEAQQDFANDCWRCGIRWFAGDRHDAAAFVDKHLVVRLPSGSGAPAMPDMNRPDEDPDRTARARSGALGATVNRRRDRRP